MSEELKPCPICGEAMNLAIMNNQWAPGKLYYVQCLSGMCINGKSIAHESVETAVSAWNALPRALVWTTDVPREPGFYYAEHIYGDNMEYINISVIEAIDRTHWRYLDWEKRRGNPGCLLAIGYGIVPISTYSRFAGPIPTPQEQKS